MHMGVLLGIVVIVALTVTMGATLFTNATTWKLVREQRRRLHALPPEKRRRVVRQILETTPRDATHWSLRSMAKAAGFAPSTIHRIWKAFNLQL